MAACVVAPRTPLHRYSGRVLLSARRGRCRYREQDRRGRAGATDLTLPGRTGRVYPGRVAVVVFLTPSGRKPTTADPHSPVPVVALGYEAVQNAVEEAWRETTPGRREAGVLGEVAAHLKEDIVGDPEEVALIRELWRTHRRALGLAVNRRPRLEDIREVYVRLLQKRFGTDIEISYWPAKRGALREIKMDLPAWHTRGFPFTFMLHAREWGRPRVRVLVWHEGYAEHAEALRDWALGVNASAGPIIDEGFTPISDWKVWQRVFREDDHPESAVVDGMVFDEDTAQAAVATVHARAETLRSHVEGV